MDEKSQSLSPFYSQPESPKIYIPKPASSGLTLVIPSLKSLKASQNANKPKQRAGSYPRSASVFQDVDNQEKKIQRPVKLKPLKEVLVKLITQLKKKDDYAFFLRPVDVANVPGYSDVVKRPMDLGTMSDKVNKGKYRSLEDFTSDFRLVTNNAKSFNPPGTIYHTEADRLEVWGLEHIAKAASTVIQYETDWNIEIEKDDEGTPVNVEDDEDENVGTPMDVDTRERSVSIASQPQPIASRRGPRGPYKKHGQAAPATTLSETLEPDGGLPGSKDGLGSFPSGSDWAKTMVALKLKGKRYKTKKERMRIERDGPPLLADGSLDYTEMEDPFSVLSVFVPEPPSRPHLVPLYAPLTPAPHLFSDPSSSQTPQPPPAPSSSFPSATSIPTNHLPPALPFLHSDNPGNQQPRRRHWVISRNASSRKGKEKEEEQELGSELPAWQMPREPHAFDFGSFALLAGELTEEMRRRGLTPSVEKEEEVNLDLIRNSLERQDTTNVLDGTSSTTSDTADLLANGYWSAQRAAEAEDYLKDVVYGGVDGFAYVRSLAEFVDRSSVCEDPEDPEYESCTPEDSVLGMSLAKWVEANVVDPLTEGRHSLLREAALELARPHPQQRPEGTVASQVAASLHLYPVALVALSALLHIRLHKIDMASLIKAPDELFLSEEEWVGKSLREQRKNKLLEEVDKERVDDGDAMEVEEPEQTWVGVDASLVKDRVNGRLTTYDQEGPEELSEVLDYVANVIVKLDQKIRSGELYGTSKPIATVDMRSDDHTTSKSDTEEDAPNGKSETSSSTQATVPALTTVAIPAEDPIIRNLRLNLLALAKRAPLDTIARLPKDLVPEHIRHFVPTLGSSG
ncbi:hypothetical protein M413DRAFT_443069 [Hebeloma cylindrosporum]|uniref:Bromo domain-containing protein n=1 Tax=Hebeloma cylindrosporum TaxID=76867 RepID=A0A0C2YSJ9_HEBCY|nr:hypothetical protein M413DRAFT_443069 [Hebeloma cylindrosporum h7]